MAVFQCSTLQSVLSVFTTVLQVSADRMAASTGERCKSVAAKEVTHLFHTHFSLGNW